MSSPAEDGAGRRRIGLYGATLVGVGGIVGGGVLMLAGTAFASAGPAAIVAFALNGVIALVTAMSMAEIATAFPESGGAYTYARKVLSVRAAFAVGWVLWFAYIVAAVLYALGFAAFSVIAIDGIIRGLGGTPPEALGGRNFTLLLGTLATAGYSLQLARRSGGGGRWETLGKVVLFGFIIAAGLLALLRQPVDHTLGTLDPFIVGGAGGLLAAMGFTFISLQGFEMIAAIGGEIREPRRTIPRAMFLSLSIALAIYLPLLAIMATAGVGRGEHITELAITDPDSVMPISVRRFLGEPGYWIVIAAIIVSALSALQANLLTASRVAMAMARDRTLPGVLGQTHPERGTPIMAIFATGLAVVAILFMSSDLAAAGAAASLIFLFAFALTHFIAYLMRTRGSGLVDSAYHTPWFPLIPVAGGLACVGLAVFQTMVVPDAGGIVLIWLGLGTILYVALFKGKAETADVSAEALDPRLARLRGKNPLVLVPVANPRNARSLVEVANALAPSDYARVLLLTIVKSSAGRDKEMLTRLADAQEAVKQALTASYTVGQEPEALITAAAEPWAEIRRIAEEHRCESLLIGLREQADHLPDRQLEDLINEVEADVAIMRAPADWRIGAVARVLVPVGRRGEEHELRTRLLATLCRETPREIVFLHVAGVDATEEEVADAVRAIAGVADMNIPVTPKIEVVRSADPPAAIIAEAARFDLLLMGVRRGRTGRKVLGGVNRRIASGAPCAVMLLSGRGTAMGELYRPLRGVIKDAVGIIPFAPRGRPDTQSE